MSDLKDEVEKLNSERYYVKLYNLKEGEISNQIAINRQKALDKETANLNKKLKEFMES